jgi:hypothetical protein
MDDILIKKILFYFSEFLDIELDNLIIIKLMSFSINLKLNSDGIQSHSETTYKTKFCSDP